MKCNKVICTECSTRINGINHCAACVADLGAQKSGDLRIESVPLKLLGAVLLSGVVALGSYAILHMLLLW